MKENKLAELSMDFSVQIINLVKDLKAKHESVISRDRAQGGERNRLLARTSASNMVHR